jgi:riboflavin synthase
MCGGEPTIEEAEKEMTETLVLLGRLAAHVTEPVMMLASGAALLSLAGALRRRGSLDSPQRT